MTTEQHPYPDYKPSGVLWLGDVPEHWDVRRGKGLLVPIDMRSTTGDEELLTVSAQRGVVPRDSANVTMFKAESYIGYKLCWPGDLVINSLWAWAHGLGVSRHHGIVSSVYGVYRPLQMADARFIHLLVRSVPFQWELQVRSKGIWVSRLQLTDEAFLGAPFPLPPLPEQRAIGRYLDYMDRRIRRYVEAKRKLIALLEEEKQAIVNRAVTRGLNPNVRLKPSGVEWLGDVPEHWAVRTLAQAADSFRTGPFGSMLHQSDYVEGGTPVINPVHMRDGAIVEDPSCTVSEVVADRLSSYRLGLHDIVFSRRGDLGRCALVRSRETGWLCGTGSIRVRIEYRDMEPEFLIRALQVRRVGEYLSLVSVGATMANLNTGILKSVPILVPPIQEQRDLLECIGRRSRTIDAAIARARRQIALVQEYRTRLIADVVTGKLDVREAAARLPDEADDQDPIEESGPLADGLDDALYDIDESVEKLAIESEVTA